MPFGNHAEGAGCGPRFDCTILEAARWLLGSGFGDVFVGKSGEQLYLQLFWSLSVHPRVQCGSLRIQLYCREQRNVRFGWDPGHTEQAQVSDCNYGFVSKQGHPRTVKRIMPHLCGPSNPAASMVLVHSGTSKSSGAVAINRTARTVAIRLLPALIWLSVHGSKRRASESGSPCAGVFVHTPEWGSLPGWSRRAMSKSLSWLASGHSTLTRQVNRAGGRQSPGRFNARSPSGRWSSFCRLAAAALSLERPPGVCRWSPTKTMRAGCWMAASAAISW